MKSNTDRERAARFQALIADAGGQAAFCRKVWPRERDPVAANKGKVSKWAAGLAGISRREAETVAAAFGRRPAWLLWGELPEREGITRSLAELADDVRREVITRAFDGTGYEPFIRGTLESMIDGETLLAELATAVRGELAASASHLERTLSLRRVIDWLRESRGARPDTKDAIARLEALQSVPPPGRFFSLVRLAAHKAQRERNVRDTRSDEEMRRRGRTTNYEVGEDGKMREVPVKSLASVFASFAETTTKARPPRASGKRKAAKDSPRTKGGK
jgi:hypothetical protein